MCGVATKEQHPKKNSKKSPEDEEVQKIEFLCGVATYLRFTHKICFSPKNARKCFVNLSNLEPKSKYNTCRIIYRQKCSKKIHAKIQFFTKKLAKLNPSQKYLNPLKYRSIKFYPLSNHIHVA